MPSICFKTHLDLAFTAFRAREQLSRLLRLMSSFVVFRQAGHLVDNIVDILGRGVCRCGMIKSMDGFTHSSSNAIGSANEGAMSEAGG